MSAAVDDYVYLLGRGYGESSSLKLVGDRYELRKRQRIAVERVACTPQARGHRMSSCLKPETLGSVVAIDGYNQLITVESALSDGIILQGRDGAVRDLASVHGSYRNVSETMPALVCIGEALQLLEVETATWYLDRPISNSGRLAQLIRDLAVERGWDWTVDVVFNPDRELVAGNDVVISSDSWILDNCSQWFNLFQFLVDSAAVQCRPIAL